jgi:hypothetical protein
MTILNSLQKPFSGGDAQVDGAETTRSDDGQLPIPGYDTLGVKEILAGLEGADSETLQATRVYERKFQKRPDVLDEVATALRQRRAAPTHRG